MKPYRNRLGKIRLADSDGDPIGARCVAKHNKACRAGRERNQSLAGDDQRIYGIDGKSIDRFHVDADDRIVQSDITVMLAASTAGSPRDSLTSWIAAAAAELAALASIHESLFLSATR